MFKKVFLDLNKSFIENYSTSPESLNFNVFNNGFIMDFFSNSTAIARTFLIISLIVCIISLLFSFETFSSARLKKTIIDTVFSIFLLGIIKYLIDWLAQGSSLFTVLWSGEIKNGNIILMLLDKCGLNNAVLPTLNFAFLFVVLILLIIMFMLYAFNSIISLLLMISIILYPFVISLYPIDIFKKVFKNFNTLVLILFFIVPLQSLCITISTKLFLNNIFSINSLAATFGLLIIITFIIPGLALASFNRVFSTSN